MSTAEGPVVAVDGKGTFFSTLRFPLFAGSLFLESMKRPSPAIVPAKANNLTEFFLKKRNAPNLD